MKRFSICAVLSLFLFASCAPELTVQAKATNGADISIKTSLQSDALSELLGSLSGAGDASLSAGASSSAPTPSSFFSADDLKAFLSSAGFQDTTASVSPSGQVQARGTCADLQAGSIAQLGLVSRSKNSLTLTVGASQWKKIYESASEESRGYLDLLMVPALSDEAMGLAEYRSLLSSVYGPSIAREITDSPIVIFLAAPASTGGKKTKITTTLGALLIRTEEKSWSVQW